MDPGMWVPQHSIERIGNHAAIDDDADPIAVLNNVSKSCVIMTTVQPQLRMKIQQ